MKAIEADSDSNILNPRLIARVYVAIIRILRLFDHVSTHIPTYEVLTLLRSFVAIYPSNVIRKPSPKLHFQSTRNSLGITLSDINITS